MQATYPKILPLVTHSIQSAVTVKSSEIHLGQDIDVTTNTPKYESFIHMV